MKLPAENKEKRVTFSHGKGVTCTLAPCAVHQACLGCMIAAKCNFHQGFRVLGWVENEQWNGLAIDNFDNG